MTEHDGVIDFLSQRKDTTCVYFSDLKLRPLAGYNRGPIIRNAKLPNNGCLQDSYIHDLIVSANPLIGPAAESVRDGVFLNHHSCPFDSEQLQFIFLSETVAFELYFY